MHTTRNVTKEISPKHKQQMNHHLKHVFDNIAEQSSDYLFLKAPAKTVSETKSQVSASKLRPKMVKNKWMSGV